MASTLITRLTHRLFGAPLLRNSIRGELVEEMVAMALGITVTVTELAEQRDAFAPRPPTANNHAARGRRNRPEARQHFLKALA